MSAAATRDQLLGLLEPAVHEHGFDLEDLVVQPAGRRRLVRVVVDGDGGVSLDDIAAISHTVSEVLDDADLVGQAPYVLEVTSPGVDRPLREPRHWRRASRRLVTVRVLDGRLVTGRVGHADDEGVVLEVEGVPQRHSYADLGPGRVQVEFSAPSGADSGDIGDAEEDEGATWTST